MDNNVAKLLKEYQSTISSRSTDMLKIRLRPGMEMLAQELGGEGRQYIPDWKVLPPGDVEQNLYASPLAPWRPYENEENPIHFVEPPNPLPDDLAGCLTSPDYPHSPNQKLVYRIHHIGEEGPVGKLDPRYPDGIEPAWWDQYYPNRYSPSCLPSPWPCSPSPCSPCIPCQPFSSSDLSPCPRPLAWSPCVPYPYCSPDCLDPALDSRIFYEDFDSLSNGNINGQNGWTGPVYPWRIIDGGVDGPHIAGNEKAVRLVGLGSSVNLGYPVWKNAPSTNNSTVFIRVNLKHGTTNPNSNVFFWFSVDNQTAAVPDGLFSLGFVYGRGDANNGRAYIRIRRDSTSNTKNTASVTGLPYNQGHTVVLRIDKTGANGNRYDRVRLYFNPDLSLTSSQPVTPTIDTTYDSGIEYLSRVVFRSGTGHNTNDTFDYDQISMATTWTGLLFQGEPCTGAVSTCPTSPNPCWSPFNSPSPYCTQPYIMSPRLRAGFRRVSQPWMTDATRSFPTLYIEACKVRFYETKVELEQLLADRTEEGKKPILLNLAHIVSVEKITAYDSFAQNSEHEDVLVGNDWEEPSMQEVPFTLELPSTIPRLTKADDEMMFQVLPKGGTGPYRFMMRGCPYDLFITTDGWVRGFIEESQWPTDGYREFRWQIIVEDSSIPVQTSVVNFRYRLYPRA